MDKKRVLVFPCGSEIGLEIHRSLKYSIHFQLWGASSVDDHGKFVYSNHVSGLPFVDSARFIEELNKVIDENHIDIFFPAHDSVVLKCAQNLDKIHCKVLVSELNTCDIARSKLKTYKYFENIIPVPKIFDLDSIPLFPVFLKPEVGQGSKGCLKAFSKSEVVEALRKDESLLILEYLPGKEYTIDCFSDADGRLLYCQARQRARILNGIAANSFPVFDERFNRLAESINNNLNFSGVWFFQVKEDSNGELCLLEIAPRVAGTMELNRLQGVNLPLMWCFMASGVPVSILKNTYDLQIDRSLSTTFKIDLDYQTIYVDFDDCLIIDQKVNFVLVAFLYKSLNESKRIVLLTKHQKDIDVSLQQYRLRELFDLVIHIDKDDQKYKYITDEKSIFIDDSFAERLMVYREKQIPVFSPDMIEGILIK